ncbi:uncharacterized protein LOC133898573 [Phragmites australis]|uniref:uncharacterized protein LOC133898573 n=1 Tax=Phragmites australis TaxID=29695 RepID=UPI002D769A8E|nr:uncharacterized protein LOC133898573 [Phragmites australis]
MGAGAGAAGGNAAVVARGLVGVGTRGTAGSVVSPAREERGGGEPGRKQLLAAPRAYPPPKRRAVSARRHFPPGCGRGAAAPLAGADDCSRFGAARGDDGGSGALEKADAPPLAGRMDGFVFEAVSHNAAGSSVLGKVSAADGAAPNDVKLMNKSGGSSCNVVAESLAEGSSKEHLRGKRVSEIARMTRASSDVAAGVSGEGIMMKSKVMFKPRKVFKPTKVIQESALDTQRRPFSKDKEKEIELGRHVITNGIEDTEELTTDLAGQALISSDKGHMTRGKEVATIRGSFGPRKKMKEIDPAHLPMKVTYACPLGSNEKLDDKVVSYLEDDDILQALAVHEGTLEFCLKSSSGVPSMRCQKQHGVQNADARGKVKMMCRRFEFICRTLVQAVEQNLLKVRRIDLAADKAIRKLPGFTKHGPIVGKVHGVEVGDEFLYRVELAILGLHRPYQGGIDTTKGRNDMLIAISIVSSGGYPGELSSSGELVYTGSGGKLAGKKGNENQKLERGNLALKNCIQTKTPVRVIHGFKGQNREEGSHSRAKEISIFRYDGLYHVVDCWREGQPGSKVFKYKLQKIPGQPELPRCNRTGIIC